MKMTSSMKLITALSTLLIAVSCAENSPSKKTKSNEKVLQNVLAFDHGNEGLPSDILVSFELLTSSNDFEHRTYILTENDTDTPSDLAKNPNYTLNTMIDGQFRLSISSTDIHGNEIKENTKYRIVILSLNDDDNFEPTISSSPFVSLENEPYYDVATLGNYPSVEALIYNPQTKSIYSPSSNARILEINPKTGDYSVWISDVDNGGGGFGGSFNKEYTDFYFSFWNSNRVGKYDIEGQSWSIIAEDINGPTGTVVDSEGNVFVASYYSDAIYKIAPDGTKTLHAVGGALHSIDGLNIINNELYAINFEIPTIAKISNSGQAELFATLPSGGDKTSYMTFADGDIYAGSTTRLYRIDSNGNAEIVFGNDESISVDGPAPLARTSGLALGFTANEAGDTIFFAEGTKVRMLLKRD